MEEERMIWREKLLASVWVKRHPSTTHTFSYKKLWTMDQGRNAQNCPFLDHHVKEVPPIRTGKHPACMPEG